MAFVYDLTRRGVHLAPGAGDEWRIVGPVGVVTAALPFLAVYRDEVIRLLRSCDRCGAVDVDTVAVYWAPDRLCDACLGAYTRAGWPPLSAPSWTPTDPVAGQIVFGVFGPAADPGRDRA